MNPILACCRHRYRRLCVLIVGLLSSSPLWLGGAPFPAGLSVLYSRVGSPDGSIAVVNVDSGLDVSLVTGEEPTLGPDGSSLLLHRGNPSYSQASVYIHDLVSGTDRLLLGNNNYIVGADWSLDGARVIFDYSCDIEVVNADGNGRTGFIGGDCYDDAPAVNPADGRIVFHNAHSGLYLADANGANRRFLAGTQAGDYWPVWSPAGDRIAFWNGDNLMLISEGGPRINLSTDAGAATKFSDGRPAWTPDGKWLVAGTAVNQTNGLWAFATDGSAALVRIPTPAGADINWVGNVVPNSWAAEWVGASLATALNRVAVDPGDEVTAVITVGNSGPGTLHAGRLTNELPAEVELVSSSVSQGSVHQDGAAVVAAFGDLAAEASATCTLRLKSTLPGRHAIALTLAGSAGGNTRTFATGELAFVIMSLPAKYAGGIFYSRRDATGDGIWFLPGNGDPESKLTDGGRPRLSPDGTALAFERGDIPNNRGNVWMRDLATGNETPIFSHGDYVVASTWSSDSARIIFDYSCQIYARTRAGADAGVVVPGGDCYNDAPNVNLVDSRIAYHNIHSGILLADASGQNSKLVSGTKPGEYFPTWSPDAQWLLFTDGHDLWKIRPDGTGRTRLTQVSLAGDGFGNPASWTPSGNRVVAGGTFGGQAGLFTIAADAPIDVRLLHALPPESTYEDVGAVLDEVGLTLQLERLLSADGTLTQLTLVGPPDLSYVIEASPDLAKWAPYRTNGPLFLGRFSVDFQDVPKRFFRAMAGQ